MDKSVGDKFALGFSLVEVAVSAVIISIIAIALSYALHDTNRKSETAKATLTQHQDARDILKLICRDIEAADTVQKMDSQSYNLVMPAPPGGVCYYYYDSDLTILTRQHQDPCEVIGKDIAFFDIVTETVVNEVTGDDNLSSLTVCLHTGPDSGGLQLQKTIYFRNETVWTDAAAAPPVP
jgi:hypothetical protein